MVANRVLVASLRGERDLLQSWRTVDGTSARFTEAQCQYLTDDNLCESDAPVRRRLHEHDLIVTGERGAFGRTHHHRVHADAVTLGQQFETYGVAHLVGDDEHQRRAVTASTNRSVQIVGCREGL